MRKKGITISDIAEKTGYSKTTVSFAFNWPDRISAEAVEKIKKVAREMGYMGSGDPFEEVEPKYKNICVLIPEAERTFNYPVWAKSLLGMYNYCESHGVMLSMVSENKIKDTYFSKCSPVDGFISFNLLDENPNFLDISRRRKLPVITVNLECNDCTEEEASIIRNNRAIDCIQIVYELITEKEIKTQIPETSYIFISKDF